MSTKPRTARSARPESKIKPPDHAVAMTSAGASPDSKIKPPDASSTRRHRPR